MQSSLKLLSAALGLTAVLALPACVTINIYFPAAAAEKAADKIIDDVWQLDQSKKAKPAEEAPAPNAAPSQE